MITFDFDNIIKLKKLFISETKGYGRACFIEPSDNDSNNENTDYWENSSQVKIGKTIVDKLNSYKKIDELLTQIYLTRDGSLIIERFIENGYIRIQVTEDSGIYVELKTNKITKYDMIQSFTTEMINKIFKEFIFGVF